MGDSNVPAASVCLPRPGSKTPSFPGLTRRLAVMVDGGIDGVEAGKLTDDAVVAGTSPSEAKSDNCDLRLWSKAILKAESKITKFDLNLEATSSVGSHGTSIVPGTSTSGSSCSSLRKIARRTGHTKPVKFSGFGTTCGETAHEECSNVDHSRCAVQLRSLCVDEGKQSDGGCGLSKQACVGPEGPSGVYSHGQQIEVDLNEIVSWFGSESIGNYNNDAVEGSGDSEYVGPLGGHEDHPNCTTHGACIDASGAGTQGEVLDLNHCPQVSSGSGGDVVVQDGQLSLIGLPSNSSAGIVSPNASWKRRHVATSGPDHREKLSGKTGALQLALMRFKDRPSECIIDPAVGTEFDDLQEAFEYYNLYSWECGFGVRKGKKRYSNDRKNRKLPDDERYQLGQEFNCSCGGKSGENLKTSSTRTDCPAMLRLGRTADNGWIVVAHIPDHNHALSYSYGEKKQWPSHYHLDKYTKDLVRMLRENNVGLTKLYSILGDFFGSMEKVPTTRRCLKNLCQKINREHAADDIQKTLDLFAEMHKKDPGFVYCVDPDEDGRIKTLMWTNSQSRMQYQSFGDAVTFDTTYKTNLYDMPFGLFVGVNNHFQSILFGGVLMTDETIESFRWVFKNFAALMGGKPPGTILTDQCRAMEVAIGAEWKEVVHRWCKWHVLKRVGECIGPKYTQVTDFRDKFHKMLNEMLTIEEFESAWEALLNEYGLSENPFLNQIYETRKMWVKSYFKGVFCAKMTSTQRSESANHMLKNIVPPNAPLHHFVRQYDKMQYIRDEEENHQERKSRLHKKCKRSGGPLVVEANVIYTPKLFKQFCALKDESEFYKVEEEVPGVVYRVIHYDLERVERWCKGSYLVTVNDGGCNYSCECGLFEHFGLPCAHTLRVLISTGVQKIPVKLIMKRWTKQARLDASCQLVQIHKDGPAAKSLTFRHTSLMMKVLEFVELGDTNVESHQMAMYIIEKGINDLKVVSKVKDGLGLGHSASSDSEDEDVQDGFLDNFPQRVPKKKTEKGRPTNKRDRPAYEGGSKRTRYCSICRSPFHNKLKCPDRRTDLDPPRRPPTCSGCGLTGHSIDRCVASEQQVNVIFGQLV